MCLQGHKDWFEVVDVDGASPVLVIGDADVYGTSVNVSVAGGEAAAPADALSSLLMMIWGGVMVFMDYLYTAQK